MSVGARSAAAAPFCLLQVLEVNQGEGRKLARCKADPEEDTFDEARLLRSGQPAGSKSITAWREKKPSYKGNLNRICRGTFFITAHSARVVCL